MITGTTACISTGIGKLKAKIDFHTQEQRKKKSFLMSPSIESHKSLSVYYKPNEIVQAIFSTRTTIFF